LVRENQQLRSELQQANLTISELKEKSQPKYTFVEKKIEPYSKPAATTGGYTSFSANQY
jgi:hypothetical protein